MNDLQIFIYSGNQLRIVKQAGGLWWVLRDVCDVLGIANHKMVAQRLGEDEVSLADLIDSMGRLQKTTIINEPGLYSVILRSDKPEAKAFKRWVTHDVLPSIRRTGAYGIPLEKLAHLNELQGELEKWRGYEKKYTRLTAESRKQYELNRDYRDKCREAVQFYEGAVASEIKALQR